MQHQSAPWGTGISPSYSARVSVDAGHIEEFIREHLYDLRFELIDVISIAMPYSGGGISDALAERVSAQFIRFGYQRTASAGPDALAFASSRLTRQHADTFRDPTSRMLTLSRYGIGCRGVIQVGARVGQAIPLYKDLGCQNFILLEAHPDRYRVLEQNAGQHGVNALLANCAVADFDGICALKMERVAQSTAASPEHAHAHAAEYPDRLETHTINVPARRLDTLLEQVFHIDPAQYNILEIDVQGAEGPVLNGAGKQLAHIDAVYAGISFREMDKGCLLIDQIDALLLPYGMVRVETVCPHGLDRGNALYVKVKNQVSMNNLGTNGRFGNQFFQYAFGRLACDLNGLEFTAPDCSLSAVFNYRPTAHFRPMQPCLNEFQIMSADPFGAQTAAVMAGNDISGYFQFHTAFFAQHKARLQSLFALNPHASALEASVMQRFAAMGHCIAVHYRQGDYAYFRDSPTFFIPPLETYIATILSLDLDLQNSFVYFASDAPADLEIFRRLGLRVLTAADLAAGTAEDPMMLDFIALKNADTMLISNSTFSFAASMLNQTCSRFLRPRKGSPLLQSYAPWNAEILVGLEEDVSRLYRVSATEAADMPQIALLAS